jgi:prolyl oligopeptidase
MMRTTCFAPTPTRRRSGEGNPFAGPLSRGALKSTVYAAILLMLAVGVPRAAIAQTPGTSYPASRTVARIDVYHGAGVADPYRWLEDLSSPEVTAWAEAQHALTAARLASIAERDAIAEHIAAMWGAVAPRIPEHAGRRSFWTEQRAGRDHAVLYVRDAPDGEPRVLLDPNAFSGDGSVSLSLHVPSPDGTLMAYGLRDGGSDWQTLRVRDVASGRDLPDTLRWVKHSGVAWTPDGAGFFYTRYDAPEGDTLFAVTAEPELRYHRVRTPQSADVLVMRATDHPGTRLGAQVTDDGRYVLVHQYTTSARNRTLVGTLSDLPGGAVRLEPLFTGFEASRKMVGSRGATAYVLTNEGAPFGRIIAVDLDRPAPQHWQTIVPEGSSAIVDAALIGDRLVVEYLENAHSAVRFFSLAGEPVGQLPLPGLGTTRCGPRGFAGGRDANELLYLFCSFLQPTSIYRYLFTTGESTLVQAADVPFDPAPYTTEQVWYPSRDGTQVSMFIVRRTDLAFDGTTPTILYGYGGFGDLITPDFIPFVPAWLERGGAWAFPQARGGGEYGRAWHEAGMLDRKQNTFDDFIAAAEYLIAERYTRPEKLAITGASNGGMVVGAVITQRPDLFAVALPQRGLFDMLRYHTFVSGEIGLAEYGSSDTPGGFETLFAYSPLHRVQPGTCYPATLLTTADRDNRVPPLHSYKFTAALQAAQGCERPILLRVAWNSGHGPGTPQSALIAEFADLLAFAARHLGLP